jgi:hypothetical protein
VILIHPRTQFGTTTDLAFQVPTRPSPNSATLLAQNPQSHRQTGREKSVTRINYKLTVIAAPKPTSQAQSLRFKRTGNAERSFDVPYPEQPGRVR